MPLFFTCSRMIASASSGTISHTTCSMISRDSFAIASYSGPFADSVASFCSTDALTLACETGVPIGWRGGGGVAIRWRGGGVATRARVSSGAAGPVGCRGGGAAGGGIGTLVGMDGMLGMLGTAGMPGMLGRITPGIGMLAAGTPINVRPTG